MTEETEADNFCQFNLEVAMTWNSWVTQCCDGSSPS